MTRSRLRLVASVRSLSLILIHSNKWARRRSHGRGAPALQTACSDGRPGIRVASATRSAHERREEHFWSAHDLEGGGSCQAIPRTCERDDVLRREARRDLLQYALQAGRVDG